MPGSSKWAPSYLSKFTFLKKRQRRVWNKGEVCQGEHYGKERDSIQGSWLRTAAPKGSGTAGTGKEHLLSLASGGKLRAGHRIGKAVRQSPGTSSGLRKR